MKSLLIILTILAVFLAACAAPTPEPVAEPPAPEPVVEVIPTIALVSVPTSVIEDESIIVDWNIASDSSLTAVHTAIHYGVESRAGVMGTEVGPQDSGYASLTREFASGEFAVPGDFSTSFAVPEGAGTVYLRAHAIVDGKNYWTDEVAVTIEPKPEPVPLPVKEVTLEADDRGFYPTSTVTAEKGQTVRITFKVLEESTYFGGLSLRSDLWGRKDIDPGKEGTVEFVAEEDATFASFWPGASVKKADGIIEVR